LQKSLDCSEKSLGVAPVNTEARPTAFRFLPSYCALWRENKASHV